MDSEPQSASIQSLIDALSVAVGRPVILDDWALAPVAYSRQWEVDEVRSQSILARGVAPRVREALLSQGIAEARGVVHTRGNPDLHMDGRVCAPVRADDELLGYIWVLDPNSDLSEADGERLQQAARKVAELLVAQPVRDVPDETELLTDLCSPEPATRGAAAARARERGLLSEERIVLCLLAAGPREEEEAPAAAQRAVRRLSAGHAIAGAASEGGLLAASLGDPVLRMLPAAAVGGWLQVVAATGAAVGQSGPTSLDELDEALRQARIALRVAQRDGDSGVRAWETLGADRLLGQLPAQAAEDLPEDLRRFVDTEPALADTLAAFLAAAGDIKSTAAALSLHRSGLYYRLQRIEELTGLDLGRGEDRLLAELVLRLHGGRRPPSLDPG